MFGTPCVKCGGATAIGRDARGALVRVCVISAHHRQPVAVRETVPAAPSEAWWL